MESDLDNTRRLIVHIKLKDVLKFLDDDRDKTTIEELLLKYFMPEIDDSLVEKRQCIHCKKIKSIDEFVINQIGYGESKRSAPGNVCKKCRLRQEVYSRLTGIIIGGAKESLRGGAGNRLRNYSQSMYNKKCYRCLTENRDACKSCELNHLRKAVWELEDNLIHNYNTRTTWMDKLLEDNINEMITEDILNVFIFFKEVKQKIYKLKQQSHETSKC